MNVCLTTLDFECEMLINNYELYNNNNNKKLGVYAAFQSI